MKVKDIQNMYEVGIFMIRDSHMDKITALPQLLTVIVQTGPAGSKK